MREYFEVGEYVPLPRPKPEPSRVPVLTEGLIPWMHVGKPAVESADCDRDTGAVPTDVAYLAAVRRMWSLRARKRFDEAEAQMSEVLLWPSPSGAILDNLVDGLAALTTAHVHDTDEAVYQWFRKQTISLLCHWGFCATSGGEGAVRATRIRKVEADLEELEGKRNNVMREP